MSRYHFPNSTDLSRLVNYLDYLQWNKVVEYAAKNPQLLGGITEITSQVYSLLLFKIFYITFIIMYAYQCVNTLLVNI